MPDTEGGIVYDSIRMNLEEREKYSVQNTWIYFRKSAGTVEAFRLIIQLIILLIFFLMGFILLFALMSFFV